MKRFTAALLLVVSGSSFAALAQDVTTATLLDEMTRLELLARLPDPAYETVQYSSYDRRSTSPDAPHWYANSDGFGGEPIPNFAAVLRQPNADGVGLYLVADVQGPGAIVRGWSARMGGVLRVYLDGSDDPIWEGTGFEFLARRSRHFLERASLEIETADAFIQQDADYLPMPFARGLRVTWEGRIRELHFYHLQVRIYEPDTLVRTFDVGRDLRANEVRLREVVELLTEPVSTLGGDDHTLAARVKPGESFKWAPEEAGPGALTELRLRLQAVDREQALRGTLMRLTFDGASDAQVETPVGDFFASGPGVNPFSSLPFSVLPDGTMVSRFVMPFARTVAVELRNTTGAEVQVEGRIRRSPWHFDERSMHFRARWRADHDLRAGGSAGVYDIPYVVLRGSGRLVGLATMIVNPSGVPTSYGNWWGEGDEKIFVDDNKVPAAFGTGSEDYYNYSWSRSYLFDHPYCGQPLDSGPANAGYVSNHRFQITDSIPFDRALAVYMELYPHTDTPGMSYSRVAYCYARPGALDDHRTLVASDLIVPEFPTREPQALRGAVGSVFHHAEDLTPTADGGEITRAPLRIATRGRVTAWSPKAGDRLTLRFPVEREGRYQPNFIAVHRPDGAVVRATIDGKPLRPGGADTIDLRTKYATRLLSVDGEPLDFGSAEHALVLECVEPGFVGIDYLWVRRLGGPPRRVAGAVEAEGLEVVKETEGLQRGSQRWAGPVWSGDLQLFVQATAVGQFIELRVPVAKSGRNRIEVFLTRSYDYGVLRLSVDGRRVGDDVDAYRPRTDGVNASKPLDLGIHELSDSFVLRLEVVGTNEASGEPHYYFGIDCLRLTPAAGE